MSEFVIRSNRGSDRLVLWVVKPRDHWRARLDCAHLTAEGKVDERHSGDELRLDAYFGELASQWRGWAGEKEWESLGLRLAARHDGLGHVTIDASLEQDYGAVDGSEARASLILDAGELDALARAARALDEA
jgi:hypothetical protein